MDYAPILGAVTVIFVFIIVKYLKNDSMSEKDIICAGILFLIIVVVLLFISLCFAVYVPEMFKSLMGNTPEPHLLNSLKYMLLMKF